MQDRLAGIAPRCVALQCPLHVLDRAPAQRRDRSFARFPSLENSARFMRRRLPLPYRYRSPRYSLKNLVELGGKELDELSLDKLRIEVNRKCNALDSYWFEGHLASLRDATSGELTALSSV
jgi:hypothetical protein